MALSKVRALAVIGVLFMASLVAATMAIVKDKQAYGAGPGACGKGDVAVELRLPRNSHDVKVNVLNGSGQDGLARKIATDLKNRHFDVVRIADAEARTGGVLVRYGPKALGAAWWVRAYFLYEAADGFDPTRTDDVVDVVLGNETTVLGTEIEAKQAIAQQGGPRLRKGTCDVRVG
jgi:hypothetical protein